MAGRTYESGSEDLYPEVVRRGPGFFAAVLVGLAAALLLLANGRPIGTGEAGGLADVLTGPFMALVGMFVELDPTARALAGKLAAAAFAALGAAFLFAATGHRRPTADAGAAAFLLALGSSLWAASQSFTPHPPAAAAVALAVLFLVRAEDQPAWAGRAGLPLSLAVALLPATAALALVIVLAVVLRWPLRALWLPLWALPGLALLAVRGGTTVPGALDLGTLSPPSAESLGRLFSPALGAFVFSPVAVIAVVGLMRTLRFERWLAATLGAAFLAHGILVLWLPGGGPSWGSLAMTAAWPLLFLFLPEGLDATRMPGVVGAVASVAIQALGAFAYDGRWDRLHRDEAGRLAPRVLWDVAESPIAFQLRERALRFAVPGAVDRRLVFREHPLVLAGPSGSRMAFVSGGPLVTGAESTLGDVILQGGARVVLDKLELRATGDGLFLRVSEGARARRLELRIAGRGQGALAVAEGGFWNPSPRVNPYPVGGPFRIRHPYFYSESGGGDLRVSLKAGSVEIQSVSLVPPGEPENVIRFQGEPD